MSSRDSGAHHSGSSRREVTKLEAISHQAVRPRAAYSRHVAKNPIALALEEPATVRVAWREVQKT